MKYIQIILLFIILFACNSVNKKLTYTLVPYDIWEYKYYITVNDKGVVENISLEKLINSKWINIGNAERISGDLSEFHFYVRESSFAMPFTIIKKNDNYHLISDFWDSKVVQLKLIKPGI